MKSKSEMYSKNYAKTKYNPKKITSVILILQVVMVGVGLIYLFPFLMCLFYAMKDRLDIFNTLPIQPPTKIYWGNFNEAIERLKYFRVMGNTLLITGFSSLFTVLFSSMSAYVIARANRKYCNLLYYLFLIGLLVPYQAIFVPIYQLGSSLGFVNTYHGLIFFYIATSLPFGVFLMTGFMNTIPLEIEEAAFVDGASTEQTFFRIVTPMLKPAIATLIIMQSFMYWNDYLMPLLFLQNADMRTITISINGLFEQYREYYHIAFAGIILSSIPIVAVFISLQKYFIKGMAAGALKG